ncbi:MAG: hypothetical protein H7Z12_03895 [Rhodospirillaceae bacterium]|nr:hypothetical protein [Rhodospirillales bacterium]
MSVATLPPPVDIDNDTKKAIIDGLKKVLARFQQKRLVDGALSYQDLISHPDVLDQFIATFIANRAECDDIVQAKGGKPVRDDNQDLICKVSLNQIQQLLVRTCAKKVFESEKTEHTVTETVTKKSLFGLIKKTEQKEVTRIGNDPVEERKVRELSRYIAFGWQLPLLPAYRQHLSYQQIMEIGADVVALRTPEAIAAVGQFDPATLRKVKLAAGPDFVEILVHQPQAIAGVAVWNREMYEFYRKMLGDAAWDFFARDKAFFNVVAALDKPVARAYGDVLSFIAAENLAEVQRLNIDKTEVLVTSLRAAFGNRLPQVLGHPNFSKDILRKVVDNMLHMTQEKDKLMASFALTCKAMVPTVNEWLSKQR